MGNHSKPPDVRDVVYTAKAWMAVVGLLLLALYWRSWHPVAIVIALFAKFGWDMFRRASADSNRDLPSRE